MKKKRKKWFIMCGVIMILVFIPFLSPFREITRIEKFFRDGYSGVFRLFHLAEDKKIEVKDEVVSARIKELEQNIKELEELLDMNSNLVGYKLVSATTISRDVSHYLDTLIINKGKADGITENQAVIDSFGLIGKTFNVTNHTSSVKLLTSTNSDYYLSVKISLLDSDYGYGVLKNYDEKKNSFEVDNVSPSLNVQVGSQVVSSGLSELFPSGILIGTVVAVEEDSYGIKQKLIVEPARNFAKIRHVSVVVNQEEGESY